VIEVGRAVAQEEIIPRLYPQAVELVSRHKVAGREVYLCSSSPQDFLALLVEELGMDGVLGTKAEVEDGLRRIGELAVVIDGDRGPGHHDLADDAALKQSSEQDDVASGGRSEASRDQEIRGEQQGDPAPHGTIGNNDPRRGNA